MSKITIVDTTMRDGSHAMCHSFSKEQVRQVAQGLDRSGIPIIEISHGDGLAGSSMNYGFSKTRDLDLISEAVSVVKQAKIGALLLPGIGTLSDMKDAYDRGISVIRIASHVTEADITIRYIEAARKMKLFTAGFLMMVHMASPSELLKQAKIMEAAGADYVNLADSAGFLTPAEVQERVQLLKEYLHVPVGFHAHNNLGLAVANSMAAVEAGAEYIDCTCRGLGAGAGNCQEEVFAAVMKRQQIETGISLEGLMDTAEEVIEPMMMAPQKIDNAALMLGYAGVYSSFLLHAKRAADKYNLKASDILEELGRRQMVGGQEDMIVDVAWQMCHKKQEGAGKQNEK